MGPGSSGAGRAAGCSPVLGPRAEAERRERKGCGGSWLRTGLEPLCCSSRETCSGVSAGGMGLGSEQEAQAASATRVPAEWGLPAPESPGAHF